MYARCAFALKDDPNVVGAEALFDVALSNGLAVVVGSGWPGEEYKPNGSTQVKSAGVMLQDLKKKAQQQVVTPDGAELASPQVRVDEISAQKNAKGKVASVTLTVTPHLSVPRDQHRSPSEVERNPLAPRAYDYQVVRIDTAVLTEAIDVVNPVRHGKESSGELKQRHIDALLTLDEHPRLHGLLDEQIEAHERSDTAANSIRASIAEDYLSLLSQDEINRRVEAADWYAPAPGEPSEDLQDCPVCDNRTLIPEGGIDVFGVGIVTGTCLVCGYRRSSEQANREAKIRRLDSLLERD